MTSIKFGFETRNASGVPTAPDALPTVAILSSSAIAIIAASGIGRYVMRITTEELGTTHGRISWAIASVAGYLDFDISILSQELEEEIAAKTNQLAFGVANKVDINLDASSVRASIGLASANLDTQLAAIADDSGGGSVIVVPAVVQQQPRIKGTVLSVYLRDRGTISLTIVDALKAPVDVSAETMELVIAEYSYDAETDQLTELVLATIASAGLAVSGASDNVVTFATPAAAVARLGRFEWALRRVSDGFVFGGGDWAVSYAPGGS